jgi:hypothetical protein
MTLVTLTIQGDVGRGRLLAQNGHQSWGCERRQRQCLGQLAEESFSLVLIVDHSADPDSRLLKSYQSDEPLPNNFSPHAQVSLPDRFP